MLAAGAWRGLQRLRWAEVLELSLMSTTSATPTLAIINQHIILSSAKAVSCRKLVGRFELPNRQDVDGNAAGDSQSHQFTGAMAKQLAQVITTTSVETCIMLIFELLVANRRRKRMS